MFKKLLTYIKSLFLFLFGEVTWSAPPWYQKWKPRSRLFFVGGIAILILGILGVKWYQNLPKKELIIAQITLPKIVSPNEPPIPQPLLIDFGLNDGYFSSKSVASLQKLNKIVDQDVTMTPPIAGHWQWSTDSQLVFTPQVPWLPDETYAIRFKAALFSPLARLKSLDYAFTTSPLQGKVTELKFYQDPVNPVLKQIVATLEFNYPIDLQSLKDNTVLLLQEGSPNKKGQPIHYDLTLDSLKRLVYLHSEPLKLANAPRYVALTIDKGVKSLQGQAKTPAILQQEVMIPDAGSYFKVQQIKSTIVHNEQDQPQQVLSVETTVGVTDEALTKNLHVYLLPKDYPATQSEPIKENYQWQIPGEITPAILQLSTPVTVQPIPSDHEWATAHFYQLNEASQRFLYVKVDKGISGYGDYQLTNDYVAIVPVPAYPKEIHFLHDGALLALTGEKKLSVTVRGLPAVKFSIARVLPDDINQLITQTEGRFSDPSFIDYYFNKNNISEVFSEIRPFNNAPLAVAQYTALDIGKYLKVQTNPEGPLGLFLLSAEGYDPDKKTPIPVKINRLILVTDLGLIVKDNQDGSHDVFVQSITQGKPIANVSVSILGKNGLPILKATSDAKGHVNFPTLTDFVDEREPTVYIASLESDVAFIPFNRSDRYLNYSRFDVGGIVSNEMEGPHLSAYVFSDRGIYRPGDTLHLAAIIKSAFGKPAALGLPLEMSLTDPRGVTIFEKRISLDQLGYVTFDFLTSATAPTGQYTANIYIVKDNHPSNLLGTLSLRVAEFLPDRMRIAALLSTLKAKGWVSPDELTAQVTLMNLYGAPATERKVEARILLTPSIVKFNEYPQYTFFDPLLDPKKPAKVFSYTLPQSKTNGAGQAQFDLQLQQFDKATYQLTFFAEGFESSGGRSVTTTTSALVSPLPYLIGYKPDGDLKFIKQKEVRKAHVIAINSDLTPISINDLSLTLYKERPVSTLVKKPDGTYQYQSIVQTDYVNKNTMTLNEQGSDIELATDVIGDFLVIISDHNQTELGRFRYSVVGDNKAARLKNAELTLKLNKSNYAANDEIEMEIRTPYPGNGLITIERDHVYAYQWFKTTSTLSLQKIQIPPDFQGGGYVNVSFVRDWNSPDIFMSPFSFAIQPFSIQPTQETLAISLHVPPKALPGEVFPIQYSSNKPGKIIIFAVDEGILQVTRYKTPDPLAFFFQKRALEVNTQQILDQILPKFVLDRELSAVGGDNGGEEEIKQYLNPFKRKTDLPVVYWSGLLDVDATTRELFYTVPDYFNGSLRMMAVAVSDESLGHAESTTEIRGHFVINPNVPTVVAPTDEFDVSASVANNIKDSGKDAPITVSIEVPPSLEIVGSHTQLVKINETQERPVHFKLRARSSLGSAVITWTAGYKNQFSKMTSSLSIRPASVYETTLQNGQSSAYEQTIPLDRNLYPEYREVTADASVSPLILVNGLERYLANYPYGCTEQLVSKVFPLLVMMDQPWFSDDHTLMIDKIEKTAQLLSERQLSNGSFTFWPNASESANNEFISVYAMHFLTEMKSYGLTVPRDVINHGISYLKTIASNNVTTLSDARIQAYAIYILTRNEIVTTNYVTHLQRFLDQHPTLLANQDITTIYLAATYQLLKSDKMAEQLLNQYKPNHKTNADDSDFYNPPIANAEYLYLLARHFPDYLNHSKTPFLALVNDLNNSEVNTVFASYASLALNAYTHVSPSPHFKEITIQQRWPDGSQKKAQAQDSLFQKVDIEPGVHEIKINDPEKTLYFYQVLQAGFDKTPPNQLIHDELEVYREYRNKEGQPIHTAKVGEEVQVHIQIRALNNRYLSNIAIVDLLPGGFEFVNDSIHQNQWDYVNPREDRVIFFGSLGPEVTQISYTIKATNQGYYLVPPISASSMYDPKVKARGELNHFRITE